MAEPDTQQQPAGTAGGNPPRGLWRRFLGFDSWLHSAASLSLVTLLAGWVGTYIQYDQNRPRHEIVQQLVRDLQQRLTQGSVAHIRVGGVSADERVGHTLLMQGLPGNRYVVFDPNNGAFVYNDRASMQEGLRRYLDEAFANAGVRTRPDSIQLFNLRTPAGVSDTPRLEQWAPPALQQLEPIPALRRTESPANEANEPATAAANSAKRKPA